MHRPTGMHMISTGQPSFPENPSMRRALACVLGCPIAAFLAVPGLATEPPLLGVPGKMLFADDFSGAAMTPKWAVPRGDWAVADGVATATERADQDGAAVCQVTPRFEHREMIVEFGFRWEATKVMHIEMRDTTYKGSHAGHVCCLSILPDGIRLSDYKNGTMENATYARLADKGLSKEEKERLKAQILAKSSKTYPFQVERGRWYDARLEVVGDEMLLWIDGKPIAYLRGPGIAHPARNLLCFSLRGKATQLRDFRMVEATPNPDWPGRRDAVVAGLAPR